jgi:hypothetical protein
MTRYSWHTLQAVKRAAAFRLWQLRDELAMVMGSFLDLRDAFDPDELPLEFILKRDSQTDPSVTRLTPMPARACATSRAAPVHAIDRRNGPIKRIPDDGCGPRSIESTPADAPSRSAERPHWGR